MANTTQSFPALAHLMEKRCPENGVQIWMANLDALSARQIVELSATLDQTERARAAQFYSRRDAERYVAARGLLRHLLASALEESPADLLFEIAARGKPRLARQNQDRLCFNLSHSAGRALFALAWNRELGIDLESTERPRLSEDDELTSVAARFLSERELALWQLLPDPESRRAAFFRAWARKEAYLKATGEGLGAGLRAIEVMRLDRSRNIEWIRRLGRFLLHDLLMPQAFCAALAVEES